MKLTARDAEAFVRRPGTEVRAALVYGPDAGLVQERSRRLVSAVAGSIDDPFRVASLTAAELQDDPARLADEMAALALTGGRRAVRLRSASARLAEPVRGLLEDGPESDSLLIVEAGELGPRDALRRVFEQQRQAVAIACYGDDEQALDTVIAGSLRAHGLTVEPAAAAYLAAHLGSDRGVTRQELEKLALYVGPDGSGEVTLDDAQACVGDGAPLARDDVALAALSGDQSGLDRALDRCYASGDAPVAVLRTVARHLQRLHLLALRSGGSGGSGGSVDEQIRRLRPPVFFKHVAVIRGQLRQWNAGRLARAMELVSEAEQDCKTTGMPDHAICARALMRLATAARAGAKR